MTPRQFCNWFQGVLDMGEQDDGGAAFDAKAVEKIKTKLEAAVNSKPPAKPTVSRPHDPNRRLRC